MKRLVFLRSPGHATVDEAEAWACERGMVLALDGDRGPDGMLRGAAVLEVEVVSDGKETT